MSTSKNRVKNIVANVRKYQEEYEKGNMKVKTMTNNCYSLSNNEHRSKRLNVIVDKQTGLLISEPKCSYRYYTQLMENYRSGIKALGFKHHMIELHLTAFIKKYGKKQKDLATKLDASLPIDTLRNNVILLRSDAITGSDFRSDLLSLKIEHHAFYMFEPKGAIKDWIKDDDKKQLNKKLHNQILVNPNWVKKLASDILTKKEPTTSELAIGIALATGRRLTEIMKTATLTKVDNETLLFSGQLKTKNRHLFEEISAYKIPCMVSADIVVKALKKLRCDTGKDLLKYTDVLGEYLESTVMAGDIKDYYHNRAVHKKYESTINRTVRSLLQNGNFSLKDCRALYTEITYTDSSKSGESRSAYRHRVLGHSLIETQLHYEAFEIDLTIESIKLVDKEKSESDGDQQQALADYLKKADVEVIGYARAPKIAIMHSWLKAAVLDGLLLAQITPSYIRRHCLIDGKQLNLNTIKKYVEEFVQLSQYQPPKAKPKKPESKTALAIFELEEEIYDMQCRVENITTEREELDDEKLEIKNRLDEIEEEDEGFELEQESLTNELAEHQERLTELQEELEAETEKDKPEDDEIEPQWPAADELKINTKKEGGKWLVWADANGITFEILTGSKKTQAIKEFKKYYEKSNEK